MLAQVVVVLHDSGGRSTQIICLSKSCMKYVLESWKKVLVAIMQNDSFQSIL